MAASAHLDMNQRPVTPKWMSCPIFKPRGVIHLDGVGYRFNLAIYLMLLTPPPDAAPLNKLSSLLMGVV